jgi:putative flippase GtrA
MTRLLSFALSLLPGFLRRPAELFLGHSAGRFAVVGVVNVCVDFTLFNLLVFGFHTHVQIANMASYGAAFVNSWLMNRAWTFKDTSRGREAARRLALFMLCNLGGWAISAACIRVGVEWWGYWPPFVKIAAILLGYAWNYTVSRRFVFRN